MWKLNNVLLNNIKVITRAIRKHFEIKNTKYPNIWDVAKVVLRGKFIAITLY